MSYWAKQEAESLGNEFRTQTVEIVIQRKTLDKTKAWMRTTTDTACAFSGMALDRAAR